MTAACQPQHYSSCWGTSHPLGLGEAMPGGHSSCPLGPPEAWIRPRPDRPELTLQACLSVHVPSMWVWPGGLPEPKPWGYLFLGGGLCPELARCSRPGIDGQFPGSASASPMAKTMGGCPVTRRVGPQETWLRTGCSWAAPCSTGMPKSVRGRPRQHDPTPQDRTLNWKAEVQAPVPLLPPWGTCGSLQIFLLLLFSTDGA